MSLYGDVGLEDRLRDFMEKERLKGYQIKLVKRIKNKYNKNVCGVVQKNITTRFGTVLDSYYFIVFNDKFDNKYWWTKAYADLEKREREYAAFIPFQVVYGMRQKDHSVYPKDRSFYIISLPDKFYELSAMDSDKYDRKFPIKHAMIVKNQMIFITADLLKEYE
ncbi:MAG: hypothetical protein R3321_05750 [Nitrososphaeraceae archaeon]|nr:hypothetical protein [Nitrososphaeraceae archaeon]